MLKAKIINSRGKDMVCLIHCKNAESLGKKTLLFKHGFVGHKITPHRMAVNFDHMLVEKGWTVVRFDCVGAGDSEGNCHDATIRGELLDTGAVIEYIKNELKPQIFVLHGYSMGGCVASLAIDYAEPDGILLWSPVSAPKENFEYLLGEKRFAAGCNGEEEIDFLGDRVGKEFFVGLEKQDIDPLKKIATYKKPVRIVGGERDADVKPYNFENYRKTASDAKLHIVAGATHYFETIAQQDELFAVSMKYIDEIEKKTKTTP